MSAYILELRGISKQFPGVKALDNVDFKLKPGEIHALMGENGAGKSTFIKVMTGVHQPTEGEMLLNGTKVSFNNPRDATAAGIAAIYQHATNYPDLSVTENIFMGHEKIHPISKRILWKQMNKEAQEILDMLGSDIDSKSEMKSLSVARQQMVEIAKAISTKAKIIIMDEPTASLSVKESEQLYKMAENLRDQGTSIIFISHRFEDMYRLASQVTVIRDSNYIGSWPVADITNEDLVEAMVGRKLTQVFPEKASQRGEIILSVSGLGQTGYFKDVSFELRKGEILGVTGLVGAGRTEVAQSIVGIEKFDEGVVKKDNKTIKPKSPRDAMNFGIGYLAEDRQATGLIVDWEIGKNITLPTIERISSRGWLREREEEDIAKSYAEKVQVKAVSIFDSVSSLSGGNQQKVAIAKLLSLDLEIVILDEPTKGVDIGSKAAIYEIINDLASQGYGVILVSSEMPEILGLSDRVLVMKEGRIAKEFSKEDATQELILKAAMGE